MTIPGTCASPSAIDRCGDLYIFLGSEDAGFLLGFSRIGDFHQFHFFAMPMVSIHLKDL